MPEVIVQGRRFSYDTLGDGFPLVLVPDARGSRALWSPYVPLLSELCRTMTYTCDPGEEAPHEAPSSSAGAARRLKTFLDIVGLERLYLASDTGGWPMACHLALQHPESLEGLILLAAHDDTMDTAREVMLLETRLHEIATPTLLLMTAQADTTCPCTAVLTARLPRCTRLVIPAAPPSPLGRAPALPLGHAMVRFLLHCERQRNLVRGASFLL